jgi:hypothetical protein
MSHPNRECLLQGLSSSCLLSKQFSNLAKERSRLIVIRTGVFPGFPGNPGLEGSQAQTQNANNNGDEQGSQRHRKYIAFGGLPFHPPLKLVPGQAFPRKIMQHCKPLTPVPVLETVYRVVEHLVAFGLGAIFIKPVLGYQPPEDGP